MSKRALIEHRPWLAASIVAAAAFYLLWNNPIGGLWLILLKGAGVGLLAVYALRRTSGFDGGLIALVLAVSAAADMVLELDRIAGGIVFALSHLLAIILYLRNRVSPLGFSRIALAALLLVGAPCVSYALTADPLVAIYATPLGAMAAAAWCSRFALHHVGVGAILFILSDWLIFAREAPLALQTLPDLLVWPLYYAAQFLIATGVVQTLRSDHIS